MPDLHEHSTTTAPHPNDKLEALHKLMLAEERGRLDRLEDRLRNQVVDASAVANVLPDAIYQRTKQDQHLEKSLVPIFGKVFVRAVKGSPQFIAEGISPVMLPAIRKAMVSALQHMGRSLTQTLDRNLSWRRVTWLWEAWRTGKSFGEVALSHAFRCRVERVFLFFREDGVHLADVHRPGVPPFELGKEDLVSSMFSAIQAAVQKFTRDEFQASEDVSCKAFEMDDGLTVLIEQGPKAVLAAVVRGLPSPSLRTTLQDTLDSIHVELNEALQNFRGDKGPFEAARPYLESCLLHEENDSSEEKSSSRGGLSPAFVVFLTLMVGLLAWWGITSYLEWRREADERQRWAHFQDKAREKPGIHVTSIVAADGKNGKTIVYGLRDHLSDEPLKIAQEVGLSHEMIDFRLEPYHSLAPQLIKRRLDQLVQEIETHQFDFEAGSSSLASESALHTLLGALREGDALAQQLGS